MTTTAKAIPIKHTEPHSLSITQTAARLGISPSGVRRPLHERALIPVVYRKETRVLTASMLALTDKSTIN